MTDKLLGSHFFCFNEHDSGSEALTLTTKMYANGDPDGIYFNQELSLQSNCNVAIFQLYGASITPDLLRKLANELEVVYNKAKSMTREEIE